MVTLVDHPLFTVELTTLQGGENVPLPSGKLQILGVVSGDLRVLSGREALPVAGGRFCLVPASLQDVVVATQKPVTFLRVQTGGETTL
jgi:mannose-6-phosphate isomerase class I